MQFLCGFLALHRALSQAGEMEGDGAQEMKKGCAHNGMLLKPFFVWRGYPTPGGGCLPAFFEVLVALTGNPLPTPPRGCRPTVGWDCFPDIMCTLSVICHTPVTDVGSSSVWIAEQPAMVSMPGVHNFPPAGGVLWIPGMRR